MRRIAGVLLSAMLTVGSAGDMTADKNWLRPNYDKWAPTTASDGVYAERAPQSMAPPAIGIRSLSSSGAYDYKQSEGSLAAQAEKLYVNSFKEIFPPEAQRLTHDVLVGEVEQVQTETGNDALDGYVPDLYVGLNEEELKWLINNNVISRDPDRISIGEDAIEFEPDPSRSWEDGGMEPLLNLGLDETMKKTDFLMALHKATYGVIESRPLVFETKPFRYAYKVTWPWWTDEDGNPFYHMHIKGVTGDEPQPGEPGRDLLESENEFFKLDENAEYQDVQDKSTHTSYHEGVNQEGVVDRGEYVVRLEGDTQYVVAQFPNLDKMLVTSPNVVELYLKSFLDKGILNSRNLTMSYDESPSKNTLKDQEYLSGVFSAYGDISETNRQKYPEFAPELGPVEDGMNHTYFELDSLGGTAWGRRYALDGDSISHNPDVDFFENEEMLTIDALQFIEAILRVREGDMTDTEAQIVSYKYGVNFIDSLQGRDRSTVMYLTAKGILDFEDFNEYTYLYSAFDKKFAYTLLYRVANPAARKNFSEIQLTDSDHFWIGKGFGSYEMTVHVPDYAITTSYSDADGKLSADPLATSGQPDHNKNVVQLMPYAETEAVVKLSGEAADYTLTAGGVPVIHAAGEDIDGDLGTDRYDGRNYLGDGADGGSAIGFVSGNSPFGALSADPASDDESSLYLVEKLLDDPYKYIFNKKPIMGGEIPATIAERRAAAPALREGAEDDGLRAVRYDADSDKYTVSFEVEAPSHIAAQILVDSKLETTANAMMKEFSIGVASKVTGDGKTVVLVDQASLALLDPDLIVVSDTILLNRRTDTKAMILTEQNMALVGSHIIETDADTLMVYARDNTVYYNLEIISALLSNAALSTIGEKDFYSCADLQREEYKPVYTTRGDKVATAITGNFMQQVLTGETGMSDTVREYVNLSQLTIGSNTVIKRFRRDIPDNKSGSLPIDFTVIVEWDLVLPDTKDDMKLFPIDMTANPSISEINSFLYTRPGDDWKALQEFWDNNTAISNALANVMYGSTGQRYIECGFLMPRISLLFGFDDAFTLGGAAELGENVSLAISDSEMGLRKAMQKVVGEWLQEVGKELPMEWVNQFFGDSLVYNKILRTDVAESHPDYAGQYVGGQDARIVLYDGNGEQTLDTAQAVEYALVANEESQYFNQKNVPLAMFPAWLHTSFNNPWNEDLFVYGDPQNGWMWRDLSGTRQFGYYPRKERRSYGTVYGESQAESVTWVVLPSGAIYKSLNGDSGYGRSGDGIKVETRLKKTDYGLYTGKVVDHDGKLYQVSRFDTQYLELISLDSVEGVVKNGEFLIGGAPLLETGHATIKARFTGAPEDPNYVWRRDGVDDYRPANNMLPSTFYTADTPFVLTDEAGGQVVRVYSVASEGGLAVPKATDLTPKECEGRIVQYHPVIRLSVLAWDVLPDTTKDVPELIPRRTIPALLFNDLFQSSLSRTVIDSLVAQAMETVPLESMAVGDTVLMGDLYLYKSDNGFITSPVMVTSTKNRPVLKNGMLEKADVVKNVSELLNMPVSSGGKAETMANYITDVTLAPVVEHDRFLYGNTVVAADSDELLPYIVSADGTTKLMSELDLVSSVSYRVTFDPGLMAIPVSTDRKEYSLLFTASESGSGALTGNGYFADSSSFYVKESVTLESFSTSFRPLPNQQELEQEFKAEHKTQVARDVRYWVTAALCYILAYLMIMCTLVFFGLKNHTLFAVLSKVRHPRGEGRGPDLVAIATFGIMGLDHEITGARLFVSTALMGAVFAVLVNLEGWVHLF